MISLWSDLANNACRNPYGQREGRNVFGYDCPGGDDAASADAHTGKDNCAGAQPAILFDGDWQLDPAKASGYLFRMGDCCNGASCGDHCPGANMDASTSKNMSEGIDPHIVFKSHAVCTPDSRVTTYHNPLPAGSQGLLQQGIAIILVPN
jgi:hypothetical protein